MPRALIKINGVDGSDDDLPLGVLVQLDNDGTGGETTWAWVITDQPDGPADVLSSAAIRNPTFTPTKEGTYRLLVTVNAASGSPLTNTAIAAVRQLRTRERVPALAEVNEDGPLGWREAVNLFLQLADRLAGDSGVVVGKANSGGCARGTVVFVPSVATLATGLPGEATIPAFQEASAATASEVLNVLGVVEGGVDGNPSPANGALIRVRLFGLFGPVAGVAAVGDPVWVDNAGQLSLSEGTVGRLVGHVVAAVGGPAYWLMVEAANVAFENLGSAVVDGNWLFSVGQIAFQVGGEANGISFPLWRILQDAVKGGLLTIRNLTTGREVVEFKDAPSDLRGMAVNPDAVGGTVDHFPGLRVYAGDGVGDVYRMNVRYDGQTHRFIFLAENDGGVPGGPFVATDTVLQFGAHDATHATTPSFLLASNDGVGGTKVALAGLLPSGVFQWLIDALEMNFTGAELTAVKDPTTAQSAATKHYVDTTAAVGLLVFGDSTTPNAAGNTSFLHPGTGPLSGAAEPKIPGGGAGITARTIRVHATTGPTVDKQTFTLRANGVDTALTVDLAAGAVDASATIPINIGGPNLLSVKCVSGAALVLGAVNVTVSVEYTNGM